MVYKRLCALIVMVILTTGCATVETESWQNCAIGGALLGGSTGAFVDSAADVAVGAIAGGGVGSVMCDETTLAKAGIEPDTDNDGVVDSRDECPSTVPNATVGRSGCSLDTEDVRELALRNVNFHTASANLTGAAKEILLTIIEDFNTNEGNVSLLLSGHTDSVGENDYNQGLSERRAEAVRNFMVSNGYDADLLAVEWFGEGHATSDNSTSMGRAENRRVELSTKE